MSAVPAIACRSASVGAASVRFGAFGALLAGPLYEIITPASRRVCRSVTATSTVDSAFVGAGADPRDQAQRPDHLVGRE